MPRALLITFLLAGLPASAQLVIPGFDAARIGASLTNDLDLGTGNGDLSISRFEARSVLSHGFSPVEGLFILPLFEYTLTSLDFDGAPAPFRDEDLHSIALSSYILMMRENSPWFGGVWARAELASDFRHIDGDDFTFDLAAFAGYRFNENFTFGLGGAVINLNGDERFYPGGVLDWIVNDHLRVGIYGPILMAAWSLDEDWLFTLRGDPAGGLWNVTAPSGESRSIDLDSYRLGVYASRRLGGNWWLTAGCGMAIANDLHYTTPGGRKISSLDPDNGFFGMLALRLKAW